MSRRDAAQVLAMCAWVKRHISKIEERAKLVADVSFPEEKTAAAVDGTVVAYTSRVTRKPSEPFTVLDEAGFLNWVLQRWPTEVEQRVRPAWVTILSQGFVIDGVLTDGEGEICEHVKVNDPVVYTTTRLTKEADDVLQPLLVNESLASLPDLIEGEAS